MSHFLDDVKSYMKMAEAKNAKDDLSCKKCEDCDRDPCECKKSVSESEIIKLIGTKLNKELLKIEEAYEKIEEIFDTSGIELDKEKINAILVEVNPGINSIRNTIDFLRERADSLSNDPELFI